MQSGNRLGIYLRDNRATVVCLASQGRESKLVDCFSVSVEGDGVNQQTLCDRIVHVCNERKIRFTETAVALDCAAFMQHAVHSEFSDPKKIAATVRFDTEEALATDVSDVAVAFRIASTAEEGVQLNVFTAQRAMLTEIIQHLQINGIDPVIIDPDICCLSRYLLEYAEKPQGAEGGTLYALLSDSRGYLVATGGPGDVAALRTFLAGGARDRTSLLVRETLVTTGLAEGANPVSHLCVFDASGGLDAQSIGQRMARPVSECDLLAAAGIEPDAIADCSDAVDFALAYGAALGLAERTSSVNFRNDHMPFLGKKMRQQKAIRFASICLTILLLAAGIFFHSQLLRENQNRATLRAKLEPDYLTVMRGKTTLPNKMRDAVNDLERALRVLKNEKTGVGDQESVSGRLTKVLQALNNCARQTGLTVDSITISQNSVTVNGATSSRREAVNVVIEAMKKEGLEVGNHSVTPEGEQDKFSMTMELKKQAQRT